MTKQNDLKKLVRERMEKTGERYVTARRNVGEDTTAPKRVPIKGWELAGATPQDYEAFAERGADGAMCARTVLLLNYSVTVAGQQDFRACEIVLDVSSEVTVISFGMIVVGTGTAWLRDVAIERVGLDVPTTATRWIRSHPANLDFGE